jgi:hypothetical protein
MRTAWVEQREGANPWDAERIARILDGITRDRRELDRIARLLRPLSTALTPARIRSIAHLYADGSAVSLMHMAAITLGTYAMLRPGELLGTGARRGRHLRRCDITFFSSDGQQLPLQQQGSGGNGRQPDQYRVTLGATKADQAGSNLPSIVAAPSAVATMWTWMHLGEHALESNPLFAIGDVPLTSNALCRRIESSLRAVGVVNPRITGKCFRRGGASHLTAAGVPEEQIRAQGRWRTQRMHERYADSASQDERRVSLSRNM